MAAPNKKQQESLEPPSGEDEFLSTSQKELGTMLSDFQNRVREIEDHLKNMKPLMNGLASAVSTTNVGATDPMSIIHSKSAQFGGSSLLAAPAPPSGRRKSLVAIGDGLPPGSHISIASRDSAVADKSAIAGKQHLLENFRTRSFSDQNRKGSSKPRPTTMFSTSKGVTLLDPLDSTLSSASKKFRPKIVSETQGGLNNMSEEMGSMENSGEFGHMPKPRLRPPTGGLGVAAVRPRVISMYSGTKDMEFKKITTTDATTPGTKLEDILPWDNVHPSTILRSTTQTPPMQDGNEPVVLFESGDAIFKRMEEQNKAKMNFWRLAKMAAAMAASGGNASADMDKSTSDHQRSSETSVLSRSSTNGGGGPGARRTGSVASKEGAQVKRHGTESKTGGSKNASEDGMARKTARLRPISLFVSGSGGNTNTPRMSAVNSNVQRHGPSKLGPGSSHDAFGSENGRSGLSFVTPNISDDDLEEEDEELGSGSDAEPEQGLSTKAGASESEGDPKVKPVQVVVESAPSKPSKGPAQDTKELAKTDTTVSKRSDYASTISNRFQETMRNVAGKEIYNARGSVTSLENQAQKKADEWVIRLGIHPRSQFAITWDVIISIVYIFILWYIPLLAAFDLQTNQVLFSVMLTILFSMDMLFNFYIIRLSEKVPAEKRTLAKWQRRYFRETFLTNFITIVPLDLILFQRDDAIYFLLIRLYRVRYLAAIMQRSPIYGKLKKKLENMLGIGQAFSGIFALVLALCAFLHVQACFIFFIGRLSGFTNAAIQTVMDKSIGAQYTWALMTAIGNTFPLTYKPAEVAEQWMTIFFIIVGAALYASIVGTISSFAMGLDASGRLYKQKMDELREYMNWKNLNSITRRKVMRYYEIKYRGKFFEENTLLNEMNESLRTEISVHNCRELIQKVPFLRREEKDGRDDQFVGRIATALIACYYVPGDIVITQGEMGSEMYFVLQGTVNILVNGKVVVAFSEGSFFGEVALIANIPRTASVQAASSCILYRLTRTDFLSILTEFEDMRLRIDRIYQERMAKVRAEEEARAEAKRKAQEAEELAMQVAQLGEDGEEGEEGEEGEGVEGGEDDDVELYLEDEEEEEEEEGGEDAASSEEEEEEGKGE